MTNLDQVWQAWRALSRADRARFLTLLREAHGRERKAVMRENGGGEHGLRVSRLADLTLTEADLQRPRL
ncbi:hypothetical protein XI09_01190 [Bradyrhizobium sp. CCBAU 11386]|nr:hypothetical protein [Bradyrhizobium sp. CCBAU 11386]